MKAKLSSFAALTICLLFLSSGAFAQNLLTNGSFETGDFTGWIYDCQGPYCGSYYVGVVSGPAYGISGAEDGTYWAYLGNPYTPDATLSQSFTTIAGKWYTFSFWINAAGDNPSAFSADWDGTEVLNLTNPNTGSTWEKFSFAEEGTGSDTIQFGFFDYPNVIGLDNVSVTSSVPERSNLAFLLGFGIFNLAAVFGLRRKLI